MTYRRTGVLLLVALLVMATAAPAALATHDEETLIEPPPLDQVVVLVGEVLRATKAPRSFPGEDPEAQTQWMAARTDLFLGAARIAAAERVRWLLPADDRPSVAQLVTEGPSSLVSIADRAGPDSAWAILTLADEWTQLDGLLTEVRQAVADRAPQRHCPVLDATDFENDWHDDRPGGRVHKGTDLHGETGTPIVAIEDGVVVQANWHWLGGRQIYIRADSTDDVYYYAHLDSWEQWIWTGTRVEAGDVIGTLGWSGNADTPHLHFGWMPGSRDVDLDNLQNPYRLLVEICS